MSWIQVLTFGAVYFVAVATPGPGVAAVLAQGLARGVRGAPAFIAGFVAGDLTWFLAAALGSVSLTLGNPKPMIFFVALLPSVLPLESLGWRGYVIIAAAIGIILPATLGAYVLAAARARRWFQSPRSTRALNRSSGTLMAAAAVAVAVR